jgi:hypothetical protein
VSCAYVIWDCVNVRSGLFIVSSCWVNVIRAPVNVSSTLGYVSFQELSRAGLALQ